MKNNYSIREYLNKDFSTVVKNYIDVFSTEPWNDKLTTVQIENYVENMENMNTF